MKDKVKRILAKRPLRRTKPEESLREALQGLPRITNETVAEHREEVLSSARKYIYPLKHSAHKVVIISTTLLTAVVVGFFVYCSLVLYRFHGTSSFIYRVTQVVPFPIAKAGNRYVSYESYLFELRHYMHYYETQQRVDFKSDSGSQQLTASRKQVMQQVVNDAYVKELAEKNHISISDRELDDAIRVVRSQNRLGSSEQVYEDVLREFWGWSVSDFKRELKQQLLEQKVVATLDADTTKRAQDVYQRILNGEDFATLAKQYSDDIATKDAGGSYGFDISQSNRDLSPQVINTLFTLKSGQVSKIINSGSSLEILRLDQNNNDKVQASHISFIFKTANTYIDPLRTKTPPHIFIKQ